MRMQLLGKHMHGLICSKALTVISLNQATDKYGDYPILFTKFYGLFCINAHSHITP